MIIRFSHLLILLSYFFTNAIALAASDSARLDLIKSRGAVIVGVKNDYPPWAYYDESGNIVGLEVDLAQDIADRLGVSLKLQAVTSSNRISQLEQGSIDIIIATMGDTIKRRQQTGIIEPSYYSSGATILIHKKSPLKSWAELYGKSVCLTKNTYFNRDLIERFLLKPQEYEGTLDNMAALQFGKCSGWIYDDTALTRLLQEPRWQEFKAPLDSIMLIPWTLAVKKSEKDSTLGLLVSDAVIDWHRTGKILALEEKWKIGESKFILDQNKKWNKKDEKGSFVCQRLADNSLPANCLSKKSIGATAEIKSNILSQWGIDFPPAYDNYSLHLLLNGIYITLLLSVVSIIGSLLFGIFSGIGLYKLPAPLAWVASRINDIFRMTPPLLNLYIIFFGLGGLASLHYGIQFNAIVVATVVFSLYAGASNGALLCQALHAAKKYHPEDSSRQLFASAFQHAYEGINANAVNIVKAVGLASMIAVPELISSSNQIIAEYGSKLEMMTFLLVFYFIIVYAFIFLLNNLQRWVGKNRESNEELTS